MSGISESWQRRFALIEKAGGPNLKSLKALSAWEYLRICFNFLALLFGPFYYLCKGMWRKAITLTALGFAVVFALGLIDSDEQRVQRVGTYVLAGLFCARANIDYYKRKVLQENGWW